MAGAQTAVGLGGAALIAVNFWTGALHKPVTQTLNAAPGGLASSATYTAHQSLIEIGGEIVFVLVATVIAGSGPSAGRAMVFAIAGLWILWLISHQGLKKTSKA